MPPQLAGPNMRPPGKLQHNPTLLHLRFVINLLREQTSAGAEAAERAPAALVSGQTVMVDGRDTDRYGRTR